MEIYDRDTIYYVLPLSQQSQFVSLFNASEPAGEQSSDDEDTEIEDEEGLDDEEGSSDATHSTSSFEEL